MLRIPSRNLYRQNEFTFLTELWIIVRQVNLNKEFKQVSLQTSINDTIFPVDIYLDKIFPVDIIM